MSVELTDREVAVLIDSLAAMRDLLTDQGVEAPNVKSALAKVNSLMTPSTDGLRVSTLKPGEIATVETKQHDHDGVLVDIYWVMLHRPDGSVVRAIPTNTMTDAVILRDKLADTVRAWQ